MPTTVSSFINSEIRMRWQEPFVTEGLNKKLAVNTPPGIYRGFILQPTANALEVEIVADADSADSAAVYQTDDGFSITLRRTGATTFGAVSLAAFTNKTVVLALYADYTVGSSTSAELRIYELSPTDEFTGATERDELVVIGQVVVPASGVIPAANVTNAFRSYAWAAQTKDATPWLPVIKNASFDQADDSATYQYAILNWDITSSANVTVSAKSSVATNGGSRALSFDQVNAIAGTATALQNVGITVEPDDLIYYQFYLRTLIATTSGSLTVTFGFRNSDGVYFNSSEQVTIDTSAIDASYRLVSGTVKVPSAVYALDGVQIQASSLLSGVGTGDAILVDDFQVLVRKGVLQDRADRGIADWLGPVTALGFTDEAQDYTTMPGGWGQLRYNTDTLFLERPDPAHTGTLPDLDVGGRILNLGDSRIGSDANADLARLTIPPSSERRTLIEESELDTGIKVRRYVDNRDVGVPFVEGYTRTYNAVWDNAALTWDRDNGTDNSFAVEFGSNGFNIYSTSTSGYGGAWSHPGGWEQVSHSLNPLSGTFTGNDGFLRFLNVTVGTSGSNISLGSELANTLYAKNIVKGWARIAAGPSGAVSITSGFNVTNASITGGGLLEFDLVVAMSAASDFTVVAMGTDSGGSDHPIWYVDSVVDTNTVRLAAATSGGTVYDFGSGTPPNAQDVHIIILGVQS
jgi:hypothetical protein